MAKGGEAGTASQRRRLILAEMEEVVEEVAGPPPVIKRGATSSQGAAAKGEVLNVELMGTPYRRLHPFDTVKLSTTPSEGLTAREVLGRVDKPTMMVLHEGN